MRSVRVVLSVRDRSFSYFTRKSSMYQGRGTNAMKSSNSVYVVDMRSDTLSRPSPLMRKAMFEAEVGDDVYGDDPTVNALEKMAASMLGKESSIYVPSGTMSNLIAIMAHCKHRGSEIITGDQSHIFLYEQGGAAQLGGVHTCTLPTNTDGTFDLDLMESKVRPDDSHYPRTALICVENTHNVCGGKALPIAWLDKLGASAKRLQIPLHMDGARLFNAAVYLNIAPSRIVRHFTSVSICLSKGLGSPVGSLLVGDHEFIQSARRLRKVLGGGMRQAGVIAAAGIFSLTNLVGRLADDHTRTATIARAIAEMKSPIMNVDVANLHTNILMINLNPKVLDSVNFVNRLAKVTEDEATKLGNDAVVIKIGPKSPECVRMVVYCDISDKDVELVIQKLKFIDDEYRGC